MRHAFSVPRLVLRCPRVNFVRCFSAGEQEDCSQIEGDIVDCERRHILCCRYNRGGGSGGGGGYGDSSDQGFFDAPSLSASGGGGR
jgi:hypothetical protein